MAFIDPNIARKDKLQTDHLKAAKPLRSGAPIFSHIEFSILGFCNRKCVFCPRVDPEKYPNLQEYMPLELYQSILNDLAQVDYTGGLSYSGFSEPLLHKKVVDFVRASRETLPSARLEIVTNGDPLNTKLLRSLFEAGLNTLLISLYDGPEQLDHFNQMIQAAEVDPSRVILRNRYKPPSESFGINLTNRSGMVEIKDLNIKALTSAMNHPCYYIHYRMMIDHIGDVLLCPHDWSKGKILGNVGRQSVLDIWESRVTHTLRNKLGNGDRNFHPCNKCDVLGTRQGGEHFLAWEKWSKSQLTE